MAFVVVTILFIICTVNAELFSEQDKELVLSTHNSVRSKVENPTAANMLKLQWSEFLENKANKWVDQCESGNDRFINKDAGQWKRLGQNNWLGPEAYQYFPANAVYEWVKRASDYSFKSRRCPDDVPQKECFDFTQVVMAKTEFIGCAKNVCDEEVLVTCFYGPGGNSFFKPPYKAGTPCTKCPKDYTCEENLCVAPSPTERGLLVDILQFVQSD